MLINSSKIVELCLEHVEVCVDDNRNTCSMPSKTSMPKSCKIVQLYLSQVKDKRAFFKKTDNTGRISLHYACLCSNVEVLKILLQHAKDYGIQSNINATDSDGQTPLHLAVTNGRGKVVKYLLDHAELEGIVVNIKDHFGRTPFQCAMVTRRRDLIDLFALHFINRMIPTILRKVISFFLT